MSPVPQTEYGANRKETAPNQEKKKISKWPWVIGGTALAGILGAGYLGYSIYNKVSDTIDEVAGQILGLDEALRDGKVTYEEFDQNLKTAFEFFLDQLESTHITDPIDLVFVSFSKEAHETIVKFDLNMDGETDITFKKILRGDEHVYEYSENQNLPEDEREILGIDGYRNYLEELVDTDLNEDGNIGG
jgi:hypothetical protein